MIPSFQDSILLLIALAIWAFVIAMLVNIATNKQLNSPTKFAWFAVTLLVFPFGAVAYFFLVKNRSAKTPA